MEKLKLFEEAPADRGVRKLAAKLALQGCQISGHEIYDPRKPYCDAPVALVQQIKSGGLEKGMMVTTHRPCRKCSKCLQFRQMQWRERALLECQQAPRTWFVTLTFSPLHLAGILVEAGEVTAPTQSKQIDAAAFKHVQRFFKRLRKTTKRKFRYLGVFERGEETGRPHYHLLIHEVDGPITKRQIQAQWRSYSDCRLVADDARGTASYVTKYATKSFDVRPRASRLYGKRELPCEQSPQTPASPKPTKAILR